MFVSRIAALGDHTFPALAARALPRRVTGKERDARERCAKLQSVQQRAPIVERQRRNRLSVNPHHVEHVISRRVPAPRELAVEDHVVHWQRGDRGGDRGTILREAVA